MHKLNTTFFIYSIFYFNNYAFQMNPYPNWAGWFVSTNSLFSPKARVQ